MKIFVAIALLGIIQVDAQEMIPTWENGPTFMFKASESSPDSFEIKAEVPENMWLGITFSKGMTNTDMVVF